MAKPSKQLYRRLRASGVRKRTARRLKALADTSRVPSASRRQTVERLSAAVEELQDLIRRAERGDDVPTEHRSTDGGHAIEVQDPDRIRVN